jgi:uncharacterized RDD family membrane protein YckC
VTVTTDRRYGGFWRRLAAYILVDLPLEIVLGLTLGLMMGAAVGLGGSLVGANDPEILAVAEWVGMFGGFVLTWMYSAGLESSPWQATLGKKLFGLVVVDLAGNRLSLARATGRFAAKFLSGLFFGLGFIMIGRNERKQGLHDDLAHTLVLRSSGPENMERP